MNYEKLISKIAADKESNKLGIIIRIDKLPGKTIKKHIPYVIILIRKPFKKDFTVPIEVEKLLKVDGSYAWFNISKEDFDLETKRLKKIKAEREIYTGDTGFHQVKGNLGFAYDPYRLSQKSKERKK